MSLLLIYQEERKCKGCRKHSMKFVQQGILSTPVWLCLKCNKKPITRRVKAYRKLLRRILKMRSIGVRHVKTA